MVKIDYEKIKTATNLELATELYETRKEIAENLSTISMFRYRELEDYATALKEQMDVLEKQQQCVSQET